MNKVLVINTDGGARGNPGPAAIGVVIKDWQNKLVVELGETIGVATNNQAEYQAVVAAFEWLLNNRDEIKKLTIEKCQFFLDSTLVVNQLNGLWRIKDSRLLAKLQQIKQLEGALNLPVSFTAVRREKNAAADLLVNQALDTAA